MDLHDKSPYKARKISLSTLEAWEAKALEVMEALEAELEAVEANLEALEAMHSRGDEAPPGSNYSLTGHPTVKAQPFDKQYIHDKSPPSYVGCTSQPSHQDSSVDQPSNGRVYCSPPHGDPTKRPVTDHSVIDQEFIGRDPVNRVIPEAAADEGVRFIIEKSSNGEHVVSEAKCGGRVFKISSCDSTLHRKLQLLDDDNRRVAKLYFHNLSNRCDVYIYSGSNKKKDSSISWDQNELHVTLLNGSSGGICDYKVTENMTDKSCVIYKGNSSTIIAQTYPQEGNKLMLQIDPDEDLSRVLSMIVAVGAMHSPSKLSAAGGLAANLLKTLAGGAIFGLGKDLTDGGGCLGGVFS